MYDIAYFHMRVTATGYKEQAEAIEKVEGSLANLEFEDESGLPAVTQMWPSADGSFGPPM